MSWQVICGLAFGGLLIGLLQWRRSRPKQDIAWSPVSKMRGKSAVIPRIQPPNMADGSVLAASTTAAAARMLCDGYTLLMVVPANATSAKFYENLSFNFIRDIAPVAGIIRVPHVMARSARQRSAHSGL
jgi:Tripartite tricarboxylate transporter family receptor